LEAPYRRRAEVLCDEDAVREPYPEPESFQLQVMLQKRALIAERHSTFLLPDVAQDAAKAEERLVQE